MRSLERGRPLDRPIVAQVRSLVAAKEHHRAESIAASLLRAAETETLGRVAGGIVAYRRGFVELAWERLHTLPRDVWTEFAAGGVRPLGAGSRARADARRDPKACGRRPTRRAGQGLVRRDGARLRARARASSRAGCSRSSTATSREDARPWRNGAMHRDWMRSWVAADPDAAGAPAPPGGRRDVRDPRLRPPGPQARLGEHRRPHPEHRGDRAISSVTRASACTAPRTSWRCSRSSARGRDRSAGAATSTTDLEVQTIHRDASMYETVPEGTWVLCFGWYMHALFSMRHGFPLHRNLRPIFISFHCNKRELLTPEAIEYLKRYGPVGCRDWTTVYLLLSVRRAGVLLGLPDHDDRAPCSPSSGKRRPPPRPSPTSTCPPTGSGGRR